MNKRSDSMATSKITASSNNWSYYSFTTTGDESSGYDRFFNKNGRGYVGRQSASGNNCGVNAACFCIYLYNLPDREKIRRVTNFSFNTLAHRSDSGYNGCDAKVQYVGNSPRNSSPLWQVGTETIRFAKGEIGNFSTSNVTACANLTNLIQSATSGTEYWFRLVRTSGTGTELRDNVYITITYESGAKSYVYTSGNWCEIDPYVYNGTGWARVVPKIYNNGWN